MYDPNFNLPSYGEIVGRFGTILLHIEEGEYQGTNLWLLDGNRVLTFDYGSCSGCDGLEACSCQEDLDALVSEMESAIHKEADAESLVVWLQNQENHKYMWDSPEWQEFVSKAVEILQPKVSE